MDFWASLEHKIFYKYQGTVSDNLVADLAAAADAADSLDRRMEHLHAEVHGTDDDIEEAESHPEINNAIICRLWEFTRGEEAD